MILFLILCRCSSNFYINFRRKIKEDMARVLNRKITIFDGKDGSIIHSVSLHEKFYENEDYVKVNETVISNEYNEYVYDLEINNNTEIKEIRKLIYRNPVNINHLFCFHSNLPRRKVISYLLNLFHKLYKDHILRIEFSYLNQGRVLLFHFANIFYNEIRDNKLTIFYFDDVNRCIERIKIEIDNSDVTGIIKTYFAAYLDNIEHEEHKKFFVDNLFSYEIIFFDIDSTLKDSLSLRECKDAPEIRIENSLIKDSKRMRLVGEITLEEHHDILKKDIDIDTILIAFKFLIHTDYFLNLIIEILDISKMERCFLFKAILKCLNIDPFSDGKILRNRDYALEIRNKIKSLEVHTNIANYKSLLIFFYQFIEIDKGNDFFSNIRLFFDRNNIRNLRNQVIKKINQVLTLSYRSHFPNIKDSIVLDFYNERTLLKLKKEDFPEEE